MKKYFLNEEELGHMVYFSILQSYVQRPGLLNTYLIEWNKNILDDLIKAQPELNKEYDEFQTISTSSTNGKNKLFQSLFKDKIEIHSVADILFSHSFGYAQNDDNKLRGDFFKRLMKNYPDFLSMMDAAIQKDNGSKSFLYESYFQIIKSKETDKSQYSNEDILQNIKKYRTNTDLPSAKKKILAYVSLFDKNAQLYDFIMQDMGKIFKESPSINNYWEEKLKKFPDEVQKSYLQSKDSIDLVNTKEQYMYTFSLNHHWIIAKHKTSDTAAREFAQAFHMALYDVLHQKLKVTHEGDLLSKVKFIVDTREQLDQVKDFCQKITPKIPDMIVGFNFKGKMYDERKIIQEKLEKFYFFQSLDEKLDEKQNKGLRVKI